LEVKEKKTNLPPLPLDSEENLTIMEDMLSNEEERLYLISKLAEIGGAKYTSVVHNIMKNLQSAGQSL